MSLPNPPRGPFASLQFRDFRLLWLGQVFSLVGTRMQGAALLWHLYLVTHSAFALGAMGLARVVPIFLFSLLGGVVADALDRRRLMLISQSVMAALAAALGAWSLLGLDQAWPIYAVAGLTAGVMAFDAPARQSMIPALVPRESLANALSLNSLTTQLAAVVGPALMGIVIARYSVGMVYCLNAASFVTVIGALLLMRSSGTEPVERPRVTLRASIEGLHFVRQSRLLISLMLLDFVATFFASANTLLPVFARDIIHVGAVGYGRLAAAPAAGSLLGAVGLTLLPGFRKWGRMVVVAVLAYGAATVVFGLERTFLGCFLALAGTGVADTVSTVLRQTIRQMVTPDALRGRMTSINMLFAQGGPQLGEIEAGVVAGWFGAANSVIFGGVACIVAAVVTAFAAPWLMTYEREDRLR